MEDSKENKNTPWLSVPQFGDWDQKGGTIPDYSLNFSKIREMRKQNKRDPSRISLGNEEEEDTINPFITNHPLLLIILSLLLVILSLNSGLFTAITTMPTMSSLITSHILQL
ncbi:hypothetical protein Bca52824_040186 [Brassica carinata]|uniref:RIN4 pathogenic type III effector avirulence factor Avr cleavage site domain-containing protein n=1 Tax=Brassica carinata TaxID=52824 RepID=A0A8X7RSY1_BRACI|nr:hypothetical protein Bca52824_040186 [Brassica carinata]